MSDVQADVGFEESCQEFQRFLSTQRWPTKLVWITPEDVLLGGGRLLYIKVPVRESNVDAARKRFETGIPRRLGVWFYAFCKSEKTTYAYVWTPTNEEESQYALMPQGLKLTVTAEGSTFGASEVARALWWCLLRFRLRRLQEFRQQLFQP